MVVHTIRINWADGRPQTAEGLERLHADRVGGGLVAPPTWPCQGSAAAARRRDGLLVRGARSLWRGPGPADPDFSRDDGADGGGRRLHTAMGI